jgi:hypothetical protein
VIDELDTLPKDKAEMVWRKISERVRQKRKVKNTIAVVTTPDQGITGFVYDKWVRNKKEGYELIKASTYSNPFLRKEYAEQLLQNYDPIMAELYLNGEFVSLNANKVYHFFNRNKHHTSRTIQPNDHLHIGLDFNIGGCVACVCVIENNLPIFVDEFLSYDTVDFVNNLTSRYGTGNHKVIIYPDASGNARSTNSSESDIAIIKRAGYQVNVNNKNPAIRDRINAVNAVLAHDRVFINTDKCPSLSNALEVQGYDAKGDPEKFTVHPAIDDYCFSGDTLVTTPVGNIPFKNLAKNGKVMGTNGEFVNYVNAGIKGKDKETITLVFSNGDKVTCTPEHKILKINPLSWVEAKDLLHCTCYGHHEVVEIIQNDWLEDVYCLTVPEYGEFKLSNVMSVVNCDSAGYGLVYRCPIVRNVASVTSMW